jgi:imidazolonepropionase-like amidohydrolase
MTQIPVQATPPGGSIVGDKPWALPPHQSYKIINARLIDPVEGKVTDGAQITIVNGQFDSVSFGAESRDKPSNATIIDVQGKYVCPGLIDGHVHVTATPGESDLKDTYKNIPASMNNFRTAFLVKEMLQRGFTTARDCGGADSSLKDAIREWLIPGPRLLISGHALSQTGGHGDQRPFFNDEDPTLKCCAGHRSGIGRICDGPTECSVAVRDEIRKGADFIKIMGGGGVASRLNNLGHPQFLSEEIQAMTRTAASFDTYVTAHAYTIRAMRHMIDNGVLGIEHGNFIDRRLALEMAEKGIFLTPTLVTYDALRTPPYDQFLNESCAKKNLEVLGSGLEAIKIASEAGVTLCYGSDLLAGMHKFQRREFTLRSEVQSALEILRSATINCARLLCMEDQIGQIKEGFLADLIVLDRNPLEDITVLDDKSNLLAVVKDGYVAFSKLERLPVTIEKDPW